MNETTGGRRRWCRVRSRRAGDLAATAGLALLAAACGGSSPHAGGSAPSQAANSQALAYARCVQHRGVPNYPDPDSSGQLPKTDARLLGVSTSQYQAARQACRHLLPAGGSLKQREAQCMQNSDCPPALVQRMLTADRKLARCMRSHGSPNFPDPTTDPMPIFNITKAGISDAESHTHQFVAKLTECGRLAGGNAPESFE